MKCSRLAGLAALTAAVLSPAPALAQDGASFELPLFGETSFSLTNTTLARYRGNDYELGDAYDDDFFSLYERIDVALQGDELRLETRIDAFVPHVVFDETRCPPPLLEEDPRCYLDWDLRPERLTLRWEPADWTIEAGDSQIVFGRGLALSFRKVDLLGIDTALRGGHVRYQGERFRFGLHGGVANPQNQDPLDLSIIREFDDVVVGANAGVTLPGSVPVTVGGHMVRVWFEDEPGSGGFRDRAVDVAGWSVEAPALADGQLALYAEANGMRRTQSLFDDARIRGGHAVYASAQLQLDTLTVLIEWKDYDDFLVAPSTLESRAWRIYNAAPPVEFDGPQRLRAIGNQRGGGVRVDYAFLPGPWSFSVNSVLYGFNEEPVEDAFDGVLVSHSWLTLKKRQEYGGDLNVSIDLSAGSRFEVLLHDMPTTAFTAGTIDRWMIHGQGEVTLASGDHSFDIAVEHRHEREIVGTTINEFQIGGASVTYSFGVPLTLTLALRWTDFQEGVVQRRGQVDYNFLGGEFYPSFEGRWTFEPGTYLGVFVGQTPGGQICSGGVCRDVPTFEGIRLSFVGRI
ncbi:MAG TPA: hypothetical protein RMH99_24015 [Sandaracinaceae bacterium LLY-WYZ-13_1]|nr:hypothetical protein [Sandaracinaceae bacterium LLY-WYZ-13_1]